MAATMSQGTLARYLSQLRDFSKPKVMEEQYLTYPAIAAELLHRAAMLGDIHTKKVSDLGAGTGILGIGCALLGAVQVSLVERDRDAVDDCKANVSLTESWLGLSQDHPTTILEIILQDIQEFNRKSETLIMNPPFGTKQKHADKAFLQKAFELAPVIYTLHKTSTLAFVRAISRDYQYAITHSWQYPRFPLKHSYSFQKKPRSHIDVTAIRLEKVRA